MLNFNMGRFSNFLNSVRNLIEIRCEDMGVILTEKWYNKMVYKNIIDFFADYEIYLNFPEENSIPRYCDPSLIACPCVFGSVDAESGMSPVEFSEFCLKFTDSETNYMIELYHKYNSVEEKSDEYEYYE